MQDSIAKEKKWGKKMSGNFAIKGGGVVPLMANAILNFHFDFLTPSLNDNVSILVLLFNTAICQSMTQEATEPLTGVNGRLFHFCLLCQSELTNGNL